MNSPSTYSDSFKLQLPILDARWRPCRGLGAPAYAVAFGQVRRGEWIDHMGEGGPLRLCPACTEAARHAAAHAALTVRVQPLAEAPRGLAA